MYAQTVGQYVMAKDLLKNDVIVDTQREEPQKVHMVQRCINADYDLVKVRLFTAPEKSIKEAIWLPITDLNPTAKIFVLRHIYG